MPPRIRWVITDIDGTITDSRGVLDLSACQLLRELEASGTQVGLVTGRPYPMVRMLAEYLGLSGPLIAENGGVGFYAGEHFESGSRVVVEDAARRFQTVLPIEPTWDNDWRVTDFAIEPSVSVESLEELIDKWNLEVELHVSSIMIHLSRKKVNKASGIEFFMRRAGVEHDEVIVAGDASSDLSLFEAFKYNIAPANSCEGVINKAGFCAARSFGPGFCEGIEHYRQLGYLA